MTEMLRETPSQTAGPYVHIGTNPNWVEITGVWDHDLGLVMAGPQVSGDRIEISGRVLDGAGAPLTDALVEIWQADADGSYDGRGGFVGWGRQPTEGATGVFRFATIRPGPVPWAGGRMAPHVALWVVARGINLGLATRMYFPEDTELHATDPVLARVADPRRRATLLARRDDRGGIAHYRFDIHLQGADETVFLDT